MNKEEIQKQIENIIDKEIENFYYDKEEAQYSFALEIAQKAFNLALKLAAKNVKTKWNGEFIEIPIDTVTVDKESILKLKL